MQVEVKLEKDDLYFFGIIALFVCFVCVYWIHKEVDLKTRIVESANKEDAARVLMQSQMIKQEVDSIDQKLKRKR
jgi:hypothetical protein